ncbi:VOC family protein [Vulgatibacter sp.]|uniref:VOC family protein n=1 Tax=Vulgatibacter sp. TaxID=1971226 RepID=UPI0035616A00
MFDHLGLRVTDLEASIRFYTTALAPLGHGLASRDETSAGVGPKGEPALWLYASTAGKREGVHVAFRAPDRAAVDAFHARGLGAGGKDNGAPGLRSDYSPTYYAAFLVDPDGNNVEAVFTG